MNNLLMWLQYIKKWNATVEMNALKSYIDEFIEYTRTTTSSSQAAMSYVTSTLEEELERIDEEDIDELDAATLIKKLKLLKALHVAAKTGDASSLSKSLSSHSKGIVHDVVNRTIKDKAELNELQTILQDSERTPQVELQRQKRPGGRARDPKKASFAKESR